MTLIDAPRVGSFAATSRPGEGLSAELCPFVVKAGIRGAEAPSRVQHPWTDAVLLAKRRTRRRGRGGRERRPDRAHHPSSPRRRRVVDRRPQPGHREDIAARAARANKLRLDDFGGGLQYDRQHRLARLNTTMPIISVPEVAILTMEAIRKRAVVVESPASNSIAIRPVTKLRSWASTIRPSAAGAGGAAS